jgi:hypothetical protein
MLRILLASGEEAVYRTVDELAMGISSGMITAGARFFDLRAQDWRSIDFHPEYHEALARAATYTSPADSPPLLLGNGPQLANRPAAGHRIYQMFSQSAAELKARRRPAWVLPGLVALAAAILMASVVAVRGHQGGSPPVAEERLSAEVPSRPVKSAIPLPPAASVEAMRLAPVSLNSHLAFAMASAGRRLADSATHLGIRRLLSEGKRAAADSVLHTRRMLGALRALVTEYRAAQRLTALAYRDTAQLLLRSGFWSRLDMEEWRLYPSSIESPAEAAQADTLLSTLDRLFALLQDQAGRYRLADGRLQFEDTAKGAEYERLRLALARYEGPADSAVVKPEGALAFLRGVIRNGSPAPAPRYP